MNTLTGIKAFETSPYRKIDRHSCQVLLTMKNLVQPESLLKKRKKAPVPVRPIAAK